MKTLVRLLFSVQIALLATVAVAQNTYVWQGSTSNDFNTANNWSPARSTPLQNDILVFDLGGTHEITNVPSQEIGGLNILNNTVLALSSTATHKILTINNNTGTDLIVENGSSLKLKNNGGVKIDVRMAAGTAVEVGGTLTMEKGYFTIDNTTLTLYGSSEPLNVADGGKFELNKASTLILGKEGTSATEVMLGNDLFGNAPKISTLIINNPAGASLGNQPITVRDEAIFQAGDLKTNNLGKLIFAPGASAPVESADSKIIGFAQMTQRTLGTEGISFLGYSIAGGIDDLGSIVIERRTGNSGVNFSEGDESIAVSWYINVDNQPVSGREISMQWFSDFDNGNDVTMPMQMYRYTNGTQWEIVGGASYLESTADLRQSATILTDHFSEWTISSGDNALPVALISFEGQSMTQGVQLNWATATELNNDRFMIERMQNGEFVTIGTVNGNGTTTDISHYEFIDESPANGNNYYRLVQQDFDGKTTIHETTIVNYEATASFNVYPNPSNGNELNINFSGSVAQNASVKLYNSRGTLIMTKAVSGLAQLNLLDGQALSRGLYYVEVINGGTESTKQRVLIR
ncbi:MAG: T9SS type A sorting domain-containing protein [Fulvivirga sp.]|nr:T9SS type A sorting domain-containing protein [Fulvivirga sp.]